MQSNTREKQSQIFELSTKLPHKKEATQPKSPVQQWHGDFHERFLPSEDTDMSLEELRDYLDDLNNKA